MAARVEHWNAETDGELSEAAMRRKLESKGYSVTRYVYPPGTCFAEHSHPVDKMDAVLCGQFVMEMEGERVILTAGDTLAVPHGVVHRAEVVGAEAVVSLDAVKY